MVREVLLEHRRRIQPGPNDGADEEPQPLEPLAIARGVRQARRAGGLALTGHPVAQPEPCGSGGQALSLADNVVMVVSGDTPNNSFTRTGCRTGRRENSNWMYVRSNGFLQPGWYGAISSNTRTNFDPTTGALSAGATVTQSTTAAQLGILFAIARGDAAVVAQASAAPFSGVVSPTPP